MGDTVHETESSSSSQDSDLILSSSGGSVFSQQNTSGNQSQNRRRHSLSLKKKHRENGDQSDENIEMKSRPRQFLFSSMETPKTDSSTCTNNNCELFKRHSTHQSIGNNSSFRPNITEHNANHSRSKSSTTADIFDICGLNSSSRDSPSSSIIPSKHEIAETELQTENKHSIMSHEKRRREKRCRTEQHKENSKGRRVRKDLFDSFGMSSSSSSDDMKIAETDLLCSQSQCSGNASNLRKTAKLSLVKSSQLTGSEKEEPYSGSTSDGSRNKEFKNLFDNFSHEKTILTNSYIEAVPKLQGQTKLTKFTTKAVKETSKQKSPEDAIVIEDSPDRNALSHNLSVRLSASVQENTIHHETKAGNLQTVSANSHLIHCDRTLSKNEKEKQEHVSSDFPSQKDSVRPELYDKQASSSGSLPHVLLKHLKQKQQTLTKLLPSKIVAASVEQNSKKELTEEAVVISSDEEAEETNESQVQLQHRRESGLNKKTLGLRISESTSLSQKQISSTDVKQSQKFNKPIVANSLSSGASAHSSVRKTFPALYNSFSSSSLSQEIPDQGTTDNQNNANRDSGIPRLATVSSNTSVSSMPSLQKKPSSMCRNNSFEGSPPMLSQYPIQSPPTSLHLREEVGHINLPSPIKNDVNKSASEEVVSSESSMFTECSVSCIDNPEDNLNGKLTDLIDMLDTADDDQQVVERTQPGCSKGSKIDQRLQSSEMKSSESSRVTCISSKSSTRQLNTEKLSTGTDLEVAKKEACDSALRGNEKAPHCSDIDEEIYIFDSDDDFMNESLQDTYCSNRQESENCVKDGGKNSSDVNKIDSQSLTADNFNGRTTLNPNGKKQVSGKDACSRNDVGLKVCEKDQDQNDLVELEAQFPVVCTNKQQYELEPSAATDFSVTVAVSPGGHCLTSDADLAAVKEEVDDHAFTGAADSSMYSEINDEVYILDSDDDEFFMTQSFLTNLSDNQEDEQNCAENKSALYEKDSHKLFEGKSDDKETYNKQLNENDVQGCSLADEIDDPTDFEIYDGMDSSFDDSDQENPNTGKIKNDNNEPSEVNVDDMAKRSVDDDDDDDIFLSQIDDVDAYFAHTQIDYTIDSDDEFECKDDVDVLKSSRAGSPPVAADRLGKSLENISESSVSSCEGVDTQDPFSAETQVGYPSETSDQNQYDVATLPISSTRDDDALIQVSHDKYEQIHVNNKMHTAPEVITKQNLCDKRTAIFKTVDQNRHEENELDVSPMLNADTQDPYNLQTQHNSEVLMEEHHSPEQQLPVSHISHVGSVFTMEIRECFEEDDHDTDPYDKETLSISSSSSEHSESVFTLLQTQINTEPEENDKNKKDRDKYVDSFFIRENKLNLPGSDGVDSFKLARSDQRKSSFHTSCSSVNDCDTQDQSGITSKKNNQLMSEEHDAYKMQTQVFQPGTMLERKHNIATLKNVQSESSDDQAAMALFSDDNTMDQFDFTTQDDDHLLVSDEDSAYEGQTQVFSPARELQTSYNAATQKIVQSDQADTALLNDYNTQDHFDISIKSQLESEDDGIYGGQTQTFSPCTELPNSDDTVTAKNVQPEEDDSNLYDIQTLADSPLFNDTDTQDQFCMRTKDHDQLESEDDDVYGGQTQQFSPDKELHTCGDIATAKNVQPEVDDGHLYDIQTLADSPSLNEPTQALFDDEIQEQDFYNMPTQNNFQSDKRDYALSGNKKPVTSLDEEDTQDPNDHDQEAFPLASEAALEDRCLYEQQTLANSQRNENGDFYNIPTQISFQLDKPDHTVSGKKRSTTLLDEEDTQDPCDCETQAFHLASEDRYPCESETEILVDCQNEESLYNKATQKMSQPERNSPSPYNRETLVLSPTVGETYLHTAEKREYSKTNHQYLTVGENLSPSSSVDTQDPFDIETNVSSSQDHEGGTFASSSSLRRNIENSSLLQMQTDISPVTEHSVSNRETTAASTHLLRDDDSSNDSEYIFIMETQKDSSLLATDQDPYALQTQALSTSFEEDIHGPFSVETLIDSPPGLEIVSPYDRQTLDISMVSENSQDPYSAETEVDTSSFEEQNFVGQVNALTTTSCKKDAENNYEIETQTSMHHVQTLAPHETIVVAHLSDIDNGSRERQIQSDVKTQVKSNDPLSAQGQPPHYSKNHIHEQLQSHTPEPFDDTVLSSKATQYNKVGDNSTNIPGSNVHHLQISEKNSDDENVSTAKRILQSIRNNSAATDLIKRLSFNTSQKVRQPSEDVGSSTGQDVQSPYFVNCHQNSTIVKDANTTESCCLSPPTRHAQNVSSSGEKILHISDAKGLSEQDSFMTMGSILNTHPLQQDVTIQRHEEKTFGLSKSNLGSVKRPADHQIEASSKRKCITQCHDFHTEGSSGVTGSKRSAENKELNTHLPYSKRIKVISAENTSSEQKWLTAGKGDSSGGKHNSTTVAKNTSKFKRPRSKKDKEVTKGCLTSQVELAKQALQNRMMGSRSVKPVNDQKAGLMNDEDEDVAMPSTQDMMNLGLPILSAKLPVSKKHLASGLPSQGRLASDDKELQDKIVNNQKAKSLMDDDDEDVVMPSTQDMMNLGLPILSANLPVSKKHLASGLPSQGRLASDDKKLQDKNKNVSSGKPLNVFYYNKNSIQKDLLPSVPLFCPMATSRNISSAASTDMPAHPAVSLETPASSMTSSTESKEPSAGQSLFMSNCHKDSGTEPDKLITQTYIDVILPVSSSSVTSPAEAVPISSAKFIHANAAVPAQPGVSVVNSMPTLSTERVNSNAAAPVQPGVSVVNSVPTLSTERINSNAAVPVQPGVSVVNSVPTLSTERVYSNTAVPSQPGVSVVNSVPTLSSERVYSNGRGLPSLQGILKQSTETISSHHGILKSSKASEQNQGKKSAPKVTFVDHHRGPQSLQRREATTPQTVVSQLREIVKSRPEAKLYFLSTLLHWNPVWLKEKEKIQSLPALFGSQHKVEDVCCQLRIYYSTFGEYVDITLKLLILECWETIYRDWKMCSLRPSVTLDVYCTCKPWQPHKEKEGQSLVFIEVSGLATQQTRSSIPSVGDLLIMDFWGARKLEEKKYDEPRKFTQFAFVKGVSVQNVDIRQFVQTNPIFASSLALRDQKPLVVKMTLILQHRGAVIIPSNLHKVQVISSLKTMSRQIDALINLPESPLCMQLLKPTLGGLFAYTSVKPDPHLLSKLNQEQACSVATIVKEVKGSPSSQKMFFLQGPPGTGKSHTILALIHQILIVTNFKGRICLAAPSNAAVDEMAKRIISFSKKLKSSALQGISLVRVGNKNKVHPAVKPFMLEDLMEEILNRDIPNSLKFELSALEEAALKLERELSDKSLTQEKRVMNSRKQKEIKAKIFKLKADMAPKRKNVRERYNARCSVLDNAQVICGTLNSLGSEDLQQIVLRTEENRHKKLPFTCLIIDEATQAIEVECLIPLQYKMTKVVLVGDPEQLPATVLSQVATEKQLARSLFERMDFYIRKCLKTSKSPVMMLTRQYRMHKEILNLPNSFFYDGQLVTDESVIARKELIAPYLVFDIQGSKESKDANTGSVSNKEEAICIAQLCEIVSKKIDKIGVICPYTDQQRSLLECLRARKLAIEVNTVDSFQGQEREVIILSCVRAQSNPSGIGFLSDRKRMNVALTRARLALYVIGNFDTLKTDELWEQLYRNAMERNLLVKVQKTSDFKLLAENAVRRVNNYIANR